MAWSRGFFRIWLALSALYIAAAIAVASTYHKEIKPFVISPRFEIELTGGTKRAIDTAKTREENVSVVRFALTEDIEVLKRAGRTKDVADSEAKFAARVNETVDELYGVASKLRQEAGYAALQAVLGIFVPPAVILLLGMIIAWIARGFRPA
jgi:hypothetical protein